MSLNPIRILDRADGAALIQRVLLGISTVSTLVFVGVYLDINQIAVFYAFQAILALQIFFEQGMAQSLLTVASSSFSKAGEDKSSINDLVRFSLVWYCRQSMVFASIAGCFGVAYFSFAASSLSTTTWIGPWILAVVMASLNLLLMPFCILREAKGFRHDAWSGRLNSELFGLVAFCGAVHSGYGLWCVGFAAAGKALGTIWWLAFRQDYLRHLMAMYAHGDRNLGGVADSFKSYRKAISMSWIAGYISHHTGSLFLLAGVSPAAAGAYGLTSQVCNGCMSFIGIPILTRIQVFSENSANGKYDKNIELYRMYTPKMFVLFSVAFVFVVTIWLLLTHYGLLKEKLLPLCLSLMILVCAYCTVIVGCQAAIVRSTQTEPYLKMSLTGAGVYLFAVMFAVFADNLYAMMAVLTAWSVLVALPWSSNIFRQTALGRSCV